MSKLLMASAAAAIVGVFTVTGVHAADLPAYTPPPPVPVWSWTGPYAGLHVGTVDGDITGTFFEQGQELSPKEVMDPNGILGGIQAGYNYQLNSIVLGLEGDIGFGDVDDVTYPFSARLERQIDWMATIRGRLGWAMDRTLFYATGGVAFAEMEMAFHSELGPGSSDSDKNTLTGWTVGGGVEHAVTDNVSLKAEYLYAHFGNEPYTFHLVAEGGIEELENRGELKTHTFRAGVNWLF